MKIAKPRSADWSDIIDTQPAISTRPPRAREKERGRGRRTGLQAEVDVGHAEDHADGKPDGDSAEGEVALDDGREAVVVVDAVVVLGRGNMVPQLLSSPQWAGSGVS